MESSSKMKLHINIRFYFIKDHIILKELNVKHCPTYDMFAELPIKPLQESKFKKFRNKYMGMDKKPNKSITKNQLQRMCMILELKNSATDKKPN